MTKQEEKIVNDLAQKYEMGGYCGTGFVLDGRVLEFGKACYAAASQSFGEPPQPRCPKCGSLDVQLEIYYHTVLINSEGRLPHLRVKCGGCAESYNDLTFSDFAQFFGPSAPQPRVCAPEVKEK